ncbi:MAG: AAA family ATPase [Solobacterium sp.]|nr:AAA family ATPase [Solobacterium sp.]
MNESIKINSLELDDVKRVKAVRLEPTTNGLTVIGGKNAQGKTSVLDAIAWALGGDGFKPSAPQRNGSMTNPYLRIELSNGLIVERSGKNSKLKVTDPTGRTAGQTLLNSFISTFALDLPKFLNMNSREKARQLLQIIGVGDQLDELDRKEDALMNERLLIGRTRDVKRGAAADMTEWDIPQTEPISASELITQQQAILAKNGENQRKRDYVEQIKLEIHAQEQRMDDLRLMIGKYEEQLRELEGARSLKLMDLNTATMSAQELVDESTAELEQNIANIDAINAKVRDNLAKQKAVEEAEELTRQYDDLTGAIEEVREERLKLLDGAKMPLEGLSVDHSELVYKGQKWDNMSSAEQMIVATAIVKELKPSCGFVLLDKLEQMDVDTMNDFGRWLESEGLQAIATRVSTGGECSVIIEDGYSVVDGKRTAESDAQPAEARREAESEPKWKAGTF